MSNKRLIVALDYSNIEDVKALLSQLNPNRCMVKVGLQLYLSQRESILEMISNAGFDIFLDLKLHDIPNTCLLYTSPSPRDATLSRMPSSA